MRSIYFNKADNTDTITEFHSKSEELVQELVSFEGQTRILTTLSYPCTHPRKNRSVVVGIKQKPSLFQPTSTATENKQLITQADWKDVYSNEKNGTYYSYISCRLCSPIHLLGVWITIWITYTIGSILPMHKPIHQTVVRLSILLLSTTFDIFKCLIVIIL